MTEGQFTGAPAGIRALQSVSGVVLVTQHVYQPLCVYKYSTVWRRAAPDPRLIVCWTCSWTAWLCTKCEHVSGRWRSYRSMLLFINPNRTCICHLNNDEGWHLKYCPSAGLTKQTHQWSWCPRTSLTHCASVLKNTVPCSENTDELLQWPIKWPTVRSTLSHNAMHVNLIYIFFSIVMTEWNIFTFVLFGRCFFSSYIRYQIRSCDNEANFCLKCLPLLTVPHTPLFTSVLLVRFYSKKW